MMLRGASLLRREVKFPMGALLRGGSASSARQRQSIQGSIQGSRMATLSVIPSLGRTGSKAVSAASPLSLSSPLAFNSMSSVLTSSSRGFSSSSSSSSSDSSGEQTSGEWDGASAENRYPFLMRFFHLMVGAGIIGCFLTVQLQQRAGKKATKATMMWLHKSVGVLVLIGLMPRIGVRLLTKQPPHVPGLKLEQLGASVAHNSLYALMLALPLTGVGMGYFGGKGIPFFMYTIPGATGENKNGKRAGFLFKLHKIFGQAFEYMLPIHIAASGMHMLRGHNILQRINPFALNSKLAMGVGGVAAASVMGVGVSQKADKLEALVFRGQF